MVILGISSHRHAYMMAVMLSVFSVGLMLILNYEDLLLRFMLVFEDLLWVVLGCRVDKGMLLLIMVVGARVLLVLFDDLGLVAVVMFT